LSAGRNALKSRLFFFPPQVPLFFHVRACVSACPLRARDAPRALKQHATKKTMFNHIFSAKAHSHVLNARIYNTAAWVVSNKHIALCVAPNEAMGGEGAAIGEGWLRTKKQALYTWMKN
jgi:hypothetical protein